MRGSNTGVADFATVQSDLIALRSDVAVLLEHLKGGAQDTVASAAERIRGRASGLSQGLTERGQKANAAVDAWVEQRPLLALLIAVGAGYVGARVLRR